MTKVVYKRLRRAWGYAYIKENKIELYKNLKGKKHLEILLHEKIHLLFPDHDEKAVVRLSKDITALLWNQGYRRF
jgi:hypothetical protein